MLIRLFENFDVQKIVEDAMAIYFDGGCPNLYKIPYKINPHMTLYIKLINNLYKLVRKIFTNLLANPDKY